MLLTGWLFALFNVFVLAMLALDIGLLRRTPRAIAAKEAALWAGLWGCLALAFCRILWIWKGPVPASTFLAGYLLEQSLSLDNVFVICVIFSFFRTPAEYRHRVLFWGILGAIVLRGVFIGLGVLLIQRFEWLIVVLGVVLMVTAIRMVAQRNSGFEPADSLAFKAAGKLIPLTHEYRGGQFLTTVDGRLVGTPLLLPLILIEVTDLAFAVDSIPAIFALTTDPFLVYTSNVFAILTLRSLYFLVATAVDRFHLLKYGLAVVLAYISLKMLTGAWVTVPMVMTIAVIVVALALSMGLSLIFPASPVSARSN